MPERTQQHPRKKNKALHVLTWFFMPSTKAFLRWRDLREWSLFLILLRSSLSSGVRTLLSTSLI